MRICVLPPLIGLSILFSIGSTLASENACSPKPLSSDAVYRTDKSNGNAGIQPSQFIIPRGGFEVVSGVDMSEYQDAVDFETLRRCGGRFAYIRLSAGNLPENEVRYRDLWKNSRAVGLYTGGYHNIFLNNPTSAYTLLQEAERDRVEQGNIEQAKKEAQLFMTRLDELLSLDPKDNTNGGQLGQPFLPSVLDLTWQPQSRFGPQNVKAFAPGYRKAICAWIDEFRSDPRFKDEQVIIFTKPQIYEDYGFSQLTCRLPSDAWWISNHTRTGGNAFDVDPPEVSQVEAMCGSKTGPGHCIFDQYSSFGGFALFNHQSAIDLDRFYGSEEDLGRMLVTATRIRGTVK